MLLLFSLPPSLPPPPPPAKTKPRIVSMVPVKNCCEATEAWLIALSQVRIGLRVAYIMVHVPVYPPVRYLRKQTSWLSLWRQNGGSFFSLLSTLLDLVIRCKDRDLTRTDAQDTVVAGLQAALIVTAFERLLERSRVSEWPCFRRIPTALTIIRGEFSKISAAVIRTEQTKTT